MPSTAWIFETTSRPSASMLAASRHRSGIEQDLRRRLGVGGRVPPVDASDLASRGTARLRLARRCSYAMSAVTTGWYQPVSAGNHQPTSWNPAASSASSISARFSARYVVDRASGLAGLGSLRGDRGEPVVRRLVRLLAQEGRLTSVTPGARRSPPACARSSDGGSPTFRKRVGRCLRRRPSSVASSSSGSSPAWPLNGRGSNLSDPLREATSCCATRGAHGSRPSLEGISPTHAYEASLRAELANRSVAAIRRSVISSPPV